MKQFLGRVGGYALIGDLWLLFQHQKVANRVYTRWSSISPYWISQQLFGLWMALRILEEFIDYYQGQGLDWIWLALVPFGWYLCAGAAGHRHRDWLAGRSVLDARDFVVGIAVRLFLLSLSLLLLPALAVLIFTWTLELTLALAYLAHTVLLSALYFFHVLPPTRIQRRKEAPIGKLQEIAT